MNQTNLIKIGLVEKISITNLTNSIKYNLFAFNFMVNLINPTYGKTPTDSYKFYPMNCHWQSYFLVKKTRG